MMIQLKWRDNWWPCAGQIRAANSTTDKVWCQLPWNDLGWYKCWEAAVEDLTGGGGGGDHPTYKQD